MNFKTLWNQHEAIKNHLTALAIIAAGIWSSFIFVSLHQVQRAEAEIASLRQYPVANIDLSVSRETQREKTGSTVLVVTATVTNSGQRITTLDFSKTHPLSIARLRIDSGGLVFKESVFAYDVLSVAADGESILPLPKVSLMPGERSKYQFLIPNVLPGHFLVQFAAPVSVNDSAIGEWHWTARCFYSIGDVPIQSDKGGPACSSEGNSSEN